LYLLERKRTLIQQVDTVTVSSNFKVLLFLSSSGDREILAQLAPKKTQAHTSISISSSEVVIGHEYNTSASAEDTHIHKVSEVVVESAQKRIS
jgi:hypothetical protein